MPSPHERLIEPDDVSGDTTNGEAPRTLRQPMDLSGRFSIPASPGKAVLPQNAPPGETSGEKHVASMALDQI